MTKKRIKRIDLRDGEVAVAIIHYNTPELTHACIGSLIYNSGLADRLRIVVFDNSDKKPFPAASGVTVIDNTHGEYIDFNKELEAYPERDRSIGCAKGCEFGSAKHMMTVQKLWEIIPQGFVLMESDIFIKKPITEFVRPEYSFVGYAQKAQPHNPFSIGRVLPMLCWMNVPMFVRQGARYFDTERTYGLLPGGRKNRNNWYDTGAVLLEDIIQKRPHLKGLHLDIRPYIEHYGSASWMNNDEQAHNRWIEQMNRYLPSEATRQAIADKWASHGPADIVYENGKVAVCAIGRLENRYAVEWVEHYKQLGVDKVYICDDNRPEDGECFGESLFEYIESGFVSLWAGMKPGTILQKQAYEELYDLIKDHYDWIGFFDFDEFVEIQDGRDVKDFLTGFEFADVVVMNWRTMTDNGLVHYEPKPLKERFTEGTDESLVINRHVKSFVRGGIDGISFNDPHCPNAPELTVVNVHGIRVEQVPIQPQVIHDVAWINHYNTKTAEDWATLKMRRLSPCGDEYNREMKAKNVDYFFSINERTEEKEAILGVIPPPSFDEAQGMLAPVKVEKPAKSDGKPQTQKRKNSKKQKI